jgi:hypothetical protein
MPADDAVAAMALAMARFDLRGSLARMTHEKQIGCKDFFETSHAAVGPGHHRDL